MIEMLGVLGIIGVLSVAGIAGYSQAMKKWKTNKMIEDYSYLIQGIIEHSASIKDSGLENNEDLSSLVMKLNLVPDTWKLYGNMYIDDTYGNLFRCFYRTASGDTPARILFDLYINKSYSNRNAKTDGMPKDTCINIMRDMLQPLHNLLYSAAVYSTNNKTAVNTAYYGASYCGGNKKCLSFMTIENINSACDSCQSDAVNCYIAFSF